MENTLRNKLRFFATYYPQDMFYEDIADDFDVGVNGKTLGEAYINSTNFLSIDTQDTETLKKCYLHLKASTIETIEAESTEIQKIVESTDFNNDNPEDIFLTDILRSAGFALPWMGLSVKKQIEYGWVRLKTD